MAGEAYQVDYIITLNDGATAGLRTFADATKGLTKAAENLKAFEKQFNEIAAKLNQPIRFQVEEKSLANLNSKLNKVLEKIERIKREAKGIAIGSAGNTGANARRQKTGKGASGGGTTAPQVVASAQRQRTSRQSNATAGPAPKQKPTKQPTAPRPVRGSDLFGYARINSGGIMGIDMLKGMGLMYGVSAIGSGIGNIIQTSAEYENIMQTAKNILKANYKGGNFNAAFADMEKIAREVGMETKFTAPEVADAVRFLAMAGLPIESIKKAIRPIADIALIGDTELGDTADVMTNIMTAYKIKPDDMRKTADIMSRTFTMSNTTLMELAESFKMSGSILQQAGVPFETAAAAFGVLGDAGIKATMAGTTMRTIIANMTKPTKSQRDYWATLGVRRIDEFGNLRDINEIFGDLAKVNNERGTGKIAQEHFRELEKKYAPKFEGLQEGSEEWVKLEKEYTKESDKIRELYGGVDVFRLFRMTAASGGGVLMGSIEKWNKIIEENFLSEGLSQKLADAKKNQIIGLWAQLRSAFQEQGLRLFEENDGLIRGYLNRAISFVKSDDFAKILRDVVDLLKDVASLIVRITRYVVELYQRFAPLVKGYLFFQMGMSGIGKLWVAGQNIKNTYRWLGGGFQGPFPFLGRNTSTQALAAQAGGMTGPIAAGLLAGNTVSPNSRIYKGAKWIQEKAPWKRSVLEPVPMPVAPVAPMKPGLADPKQSKAYATWQRMLNNAPQMPSAPVAPTPVAPVAKPVLPKKPNFPRPKKGQFEFNWDRYDKEMKKYNAQLSEYNRYKRYLSDREAYSLDYARYHERMGQYNAQYGGYDRRMRAAEERYRQAQAEFDRQERNYSQQLGTYNDDYAEYQAMRKERGEYLKKRKKEIRRQQRKEYHQRNAGWFAMAGGVVGGMLASEIAPESEWAGTIGGVAGTLGAMALATSSIPFAGWITAGVLAAGAGITKLIKFKRETEKAKKAIDDYLKSLRSIDMSELDVTSSESVRHTSMKITTSLYMTQNEKMKEHLRLLERIREFNNSENGEEPGTKDSEWKGKEDFISARDRMWKMTQLARAESYSKTYNDFAERGLLQHGVSETDNSKYNYFTAKDSYGNSYTYGGYSTDKEGVLNGSTRERINEFNAMQQAFDPEANKFYSEAFYELSNALPGLTSIQDFETKARQIQEKFGANDIDTSLDINKLRDKDLQSAMTNGDILKYAAFGIPHNMMIDNMIKEIRSQYAPFLALSEKYAAGSAFNLSQTQSALSKAQVETEDGHSTIQALSDFGLFGTQGWLENMASYKTATDEKGNLLFTEEGYQNFVKNQFGLLLDLYNKTRDKNQKRQILPFLNKDFWGYLGIDLSQFEDPWRDVAGDEFYKGVFKDKYNNPTFKVTGNTVQLWPDGVPSIPENPVAQDSTLVNAVKEFAAPSVALANANVVPWREAVDRISYHSPWEPVTREEVDRATAEPLYAAFAPSYTPFMPPLSQTAVNNEDFRPAERQQVAMVARPVVININAERLVDFGTLNIENATDDAEIAQKVRNALEGILAEVAESTGGNYHFGVAS